MPPEKTKRITLPEPTLHADRQVQDQRPVVRSARGLIFISYRRDGDAGFAGRVFDLLNILFGEDRVFCDARIEPGADFVDAIMERIDACTVMLAVIGKGWLTVRDEAGKRRLDKPDDYVRTEVERGLNRGIPVIPVLVDGTPMPSSADLPESILPLARRNGYPISNARFSSDIGALILLIKQILGDS